MRDRHRGHRRGGTAPPATPVRRVDGRSPRNGQPVNPGGPCRETPVTAAGSSPTGARRGRRRHRSSGSSARRDRRPLGVSAAAFRVRPVGRVRLGSVDRLMLGLGVDAVPPGRRVRAARPSRWRRSTRSVGEFEDRRERLATGGRNRCSSGSRRSSRVQPRGTTMESPCRWHSTPPALGVESRRTSSQNTRSSVRIPYATAAFSEHPGRSQSLPIGK